MILLSESGVSVRATARRVKVTAPAVSNWRKRFREQRLAGLHGCSRASGCTAETPAGARKGAPESCAL
jgi:transposase-like protein